MKKIDIVFVLPNLGAGGAEKSLINLLSVFNFDKYSVDLVLFDKSGLFLDMLPSEVRVLEIDGAYKAFSKPLKTSLKYFLSSLNFKLAYHRILFALKNRWIRNKSVAEQKAWKDVRASMNTFVKNYDVAIGFLEKSSIYLTVDLINATKKIGWIHTNYTKSGMDNRLDYLYFEELDSVVTVSNECKEDLISNFESLKDKIKVILNIVSSDLVNQLSKQNSIEVVEFGKDTIITVGRLSYEKGMDLAIDACELLIKKNPNIKWYIIGDGEQRTMLEQRIVEKKLEKHILILGLRSNPYPLILNGALYVQPSRYEGKSIAIDEAKMLCKPIVTTNYPSVNDQIQHMENGIVTDVSAESIANGIMQLLSDKELQYKFRLKLKSIDLGTETEVHKIYSLIEV